ncbi:MAG: hypothetical protein ACOYN0_00410 [Phycisphaerales bacterium]
MSGKEPKTPLQRSGRSPMVVAPVPAGAVALSGTKAVGPSLRLLVRSTHDNEPVAGLSVRSLKVEVTSGTGAGSEWTWDWDGGAFKPLAQGKEPPAFSDPWTASDDEAVAEIEAALGFKRKAGQGPVLAEAITKSKAKANAKKLSDEQRTRLGKLSAKAQAWAAWESYVRSLAACFAARVQGVTRKPDEILGSSKPEKPKMAWADFETEVLAKVYRAMTGEEYANSTAKLYELAGKLWDLFDGKYVTDKDGALSVPLPPLTKGKVSVEFAQVKVLDVADAAKVAGKRALTAVFKGQSERKSDYESDRPWTDSADSNWWLAPGEPEDLLNETYDPKKLRDEATHRLRNRVTILYDAVSREGENDAQVSARNTFGTRAMVFCQPTWLELADTRHLVPMNDDEVKAGGVRSKNRYLAISTSEQPQGNYFGLYGRMSRKANYKWDWKREVFQLGDEPDPKNGPWYWATRSEKNVWTLAFATGEEAWKREELAKGLTEDNRPADDVIQERLEAWLSSKLSTAKVARVKDWIVRDGADVERVKEVEKEQGGIAQKLRELIREEVAAHRVRQRTGSTYDYRTWKVASPFEVCKIKASEISSHPSIPADLKKRALALMAEKADDLENAADDDELLEALFQEAPADKKQAEEARKRAVERRNLARELRENVYFDVWKIWARREDAGKEPYSPQARAALNRLAEIAPSMKILTRVDDAKDTWEVYQAEAAQAGSPFYKQYKSLDKALNSIELGRWHLGIDFVGGMGDPLFAVCGGKPKIKGEKVYEAEGGVTITVWHWNGASTKFEYSGYVHVDDRDLKKKHLNLKENFPVVRAGDVVGFMDRTGNPDRYSPTHLHFNNGRVLPPVKGVEVLLPHNGHFKLTPCAQEWHNSVRVGADSLPETSRRTDTNDCPTRLYEAREKSCWAMLAGVCPFAEAKAAMKKEKAEKEAAMKAEKKAKAAAINKQKKAAAQPLVQPQIKAAKKTKK